MFDSHQCFALVGVRNSARVVDILSQADAIIRLQDRKAVGMTEAKQVWKCTRKGGCGWEYRSPIEVTEVWHKCDKGDGQRRALQLVKGK